MTNGKSKRSIGNAKKEAGKTGIYKYAMMAFPQN